MVIGIIELQQNQQLHALLIWLFTCQWIWWRVIFNSAKQVDIFAGLPGAAKIRVVSPSWRKKRVGVFFLREWQSKRIFDEFVIAFFGARLFFASSVAPSSGKIRTAADDSFCVRAWARRHARCLFCFVLAHHFGCLFVCSRRVVLSSSVHPSLLV